MMLVECLIITRASTAVLHGWLVQCWVSFCYAWSRKWSLRTERYTFFIGAFYILKVLSKFFHQLMHKRIALKGVLKFTLKYLQHV